MTLDKALAGSPDLRRLYDDDEQVRTLIDTARELEGMPRNASTHAAGVIITSASGVGICAHCKKRSMASVTQFGMTHAGRAGPFENGFSWAAQPDHYRRCGAHGAENGADHRSRAPFGLRRRRRVRNAFARAKRRVSFSWKAAGMTAVCRGHASPQSIEDITAIVALYPPGARWQSIPTYIDRKNNP